MELVVFKGLTTEEYLKELEEKSKTYEDLYADMNNDDERRFVKNKASEIKGLKKKIDRLRIDTKKAKGDEIDAEASAIVARLDSANAPFDLLINKYNKERAKILTEEKVIREAEELAIQIQVDHEDAINLNKLFELERAERERIAKENHAKLVAEIAEQERVKAEQQAESLKLEQAAAEQAAIDEENKRLADIEHVTAICTKVKESLIAQSGINEQDAIAVVKAIRSNKVFNTSIKF